MDYLATEIFEFATNTAKNNEKPTIIARNLLRTIRNNEDLNLLSGVRIAREGTQYLKYVK